MGISRVAARVLGLGVSLTAVVGLLHAADEPPARKKGGSKPAAARTAETKGRGLPSLPPGRDPFDLSEEKAADKGQPKGNTPPGGEPGMPPLPTRNLTGAELFGLLSRSRMPAPPIVAGPDTAPVLRAGSPFALSENVDLPEKKPADKGQTKEEAPFGEEPGMPPYPAPNLPRADSIKPLPLPPIPDDPPPHEGAMIDIPLVVEPPDLVVVEVLEALPGRPISGERLVRPDGKISLGFYGDVDVRGLTTTQLKEEIVLHLRGTLPDQVLGLFAIGEDGQWKKVPPRDVVTVFADVSSYNSKFYYVDGDVAAPGKMPFTGQETVLDALNYAGGLHHTADPKSIRLYRPAPGGKPAKVYPIDLDAIQRGDSRMNYQVFPGDRLVVGRDDMIQATIQQDRQAAAIQTTLNSMLQLSLMTRSLVQATPDLTPAQREDLAREWFALWWKSFQRPGGPAPDEAVFRELLLKMLKNTKDPGKPAEGGKK